MPLKLLLAILVVLTLAPDGARAQGINPLPIISHFESANGTNTSCSGSRACGIWQDLSGSTWPEALRMIGIDPAFYPTANDASPAIQAAANSALINARGLNPWLCNGCDPPFAAYVAAHGGIGAFQTSGLDTNPADYAALNDPAGLSAFLNSGGAGVASAGPGGDTLTANSPSAPAAAPAAPSAAIFTLLYNEIIDKVTTNIRNMINSALASLWLPFLAILTLAVAVQGVRAAIGDYDMGDFLRFVLKAAIVTGLMAPGDQYFTEWVQEPLLGIPTWFAAIFDNNSTVNLQSPVGLFDSCAAGLYATALSVWKSSPWSINMIPFGITVFFTYYLGILALFFLFLAFLFGNFLVFLIVLIAPFVIPALLFRATTGYFVGWVNLGVTSLLTALLIDIMLGLYFSMLVDMVGAFSPSGSPHVDLQGFVGLVLGVLLLGVTTAFIPRLAKVVGHGVTAGFESAGRAMSGAMVVQHASGAGRVLGALHG